MIDRRVRGGTIATAVGVALAALLGSCATLFEPDRHARAPLLDHYGALDWPITTSQPAAQRLFTQGMLQAYAFNEAEAVRSFKAALAQDPACAMCAWGVAYQLGPNINATERTDPAEAQRYVALALRNGSTATPRERALIDAMAVRYGNAASPAQDAPLIAETCGRAVGDEKPHPLDVAYAARMRALVDAAPDDPDIVSMYAEAVMIATRSDWWDRKTGAPAGGIGEVAQRLEHALLRSPDHTGLNHYLIHAIDASPTPQRALVSADRLGALAPQSPHLVHMPAHIYVHTARYGDAVRVNQAALALDVTLAEQLKTQGFETSKNWSGHNGHFLWFAALMEGRGELALSTARKAAERAAKSTHWYGEYLRSLPLLTLVRLERWDAVLQQDAVAGDKGVAKAIGQYARGMAQLRGGQVAVAREAATALAEADKTAHAKTKPSNDDRLIAGAFGILEARLHAELAFADGRIDDASRDARRAVELEDALEADEPPLLGAGSRLALGALMLRASRWSDAEQAFRGDLARQPGSGWALKGLHLSLVRQGRAAEAQQVQRDLDRAWAAADVSVRAAPAI